MSIPQKRRAKPLGRRATEDLPANPRQLLGLNCRQGPSRDDSGTRVMPWTSKRRAESLERGRARSSPSHGPD